MCNNHQLKCAYSLLADEIKRKGKLVLEVATNSMAPILNPCDNVVIKPCNILDMKPGAIVVFVREKDLVIHRVISAYVNKETYVLTKGDKAPYLDAPVPVTDLLGKIVAVIRHDTGEYVSLELFRHKVTGLMKVLLQAYHAWRLQRYMSKTS